MPSADWKVELVDDQGEADYSVTVVGQQVIDMTGASPGDVLTVQPDGDTVAPEAPSSGGPAGGVLSGTYPNPGFAVDMATQAELDAKVAQTITNGVTASAPSQDAVFDALALKADLASPALTGNPTAPTATQGDNDTSIATTAFIETRVAAALNLLTVGQETVPRLFVTSTATLSSGNMRFTFFTARKSETTTQMRVACITGYVGTPSVIRFGLYSVDASDNLTLVASTANDTALLASNNTLYTKAWQASVALTAGARYAFGALVVTVGTAPAISGVNPTITTEAVTAPRMTSIVSGLSDIPSPTIAVGTLGASTNGPYAAILP